MRIGMVLDSPYPEDGRVTKEAVALQDAGHEVHMLCVRRQHEQERETVNGIDLMRIDRGLSMFSKTAWDSINALLWKHPKFSSALSDFVKDRQIEALHVHDLPLAGSVSACAKTYNIPWVLDLHENYPAGLQTWMEHKTNPLVKLKNSLLMSYDRWAAYEGRMVKDANAVIAVVEEMKTRLAQVHGTPKEKTYIVTNSEWRNFFDQFPSIPEVAESFPGKYVILYLGYFGPHRGVDTVIEAMPEILKAIPNAEFVVVGKGSFQPNLEALAAKLNVSDHVHFLGLKPYAEVGSWMKRADINITPHKRNEHTDNTVPHKLFHSLLSGKPTLVSSAPPLMRIVEETQGGWVFTAEDSKDLTAKVTEIFNNPPEVKQRAMHGQQASQQGTYNWDTDQLNLVRLYQELN